MKIKATLAAIAVAAASLFGVAATSIVGGGIANASVSCETVVVQMVSTKNGGPTGRYLETGAFGIIQLVSSGYSDYKYCTGYAYGLSTLQDYDSGNYLQGEYSGGKWFWDANSNNINSGDPYWYYQNQTKGIAIEQYCGPDCGSWNNFPGSLNNGGTWVEGVYGGFAYADGFEFTVI